MNNFSWMKSDQRSFPWLEKDEKQINAKTAAFLITEGYLFYSF